MPQFSCFTPHFLMSHGHFLRCTTLIFDIPKGILGGADTHFGEQGLTRLGGFFHFRLFLSKRCCLCAKKDVSLQYQNLKPKYDFNQYDI